MLHVWFKGTFYAPLGYTALLCHHLFCWYGKLVCKQLLIYTSCVCVQRMNIAIFYIIAALHFLSRICGFLTAKCSTAFTCMTSLVLRVFSLKSCLKRRWVWSTAVELWALIPNWMATLNGLSSECIQLQEALREGCVSVNHHPRCLKLGLVTQCEWVCNTDGWRLYSWRLVWKSANFVYTALSKTVVPKCYTVHNKMYNCTEH